MIVPNVIESFINSLDYSLKILSVSYDSPSNITSIEVADKLYAREYLNVLIDSVPNKILSVTGNVLTFSGEIIPTTISLIPPYFAHGTPYAVNVELDRHIEYPLVYLLEIVREEIPSDLDSRFETIPTLRLFFLDEANFKDWDTDELYSNVVALQRDYCNFVLKNIKKSKVFGLPTNIEITSFAKFGVYQNEKGVLNSLFNKQLSGVELRIDLPIVKRFSC